MSTVEMTEEEVKTLRGSKVLMDRLLKDPKTRRQAEGLVKQLYPETVTTDDVASPYIERIDGLEKKLEKYFKEQEGKELDSRLNEQIAQLREDGYTAEGIEKIKEIMVKEQIPNAIAASKLWDKANPPQPSENSNFAPTDWNFGGKQDDPDLKLLFEDEDRWAEKEARKAWDEESRKSGRILT
jgi:hypothetical protein